MGKLSFKDWLTEQTKKQPTEQEIAKKIQDWLDALDSLYTQMSNWLRQDDPGRVVKIWQASEAIEEEELGIYSAPSLRFVINHRTATVMPIARNVIGPAPGSGPLASLRGEGRVDLASGVDRFHLYRVRDSQDKSRWVIVNQDQLTFKDFDKETFQNALQRLFS
jgi:hypothetical protein